MLLVKTKQLLFKSSFVLMVLTLALIPVVNVSGYTANEVSASTYNAIGLSDTTSEFSVITYNVAGLPDILSSGNPEVNTA